MREVFIAHFVMPSVSDVEHGRLLKFTCNRQAFPVAFFFGRVPAVPPGYCKFQIACGIRVVTAMLAIIEGLFAFNVDTFPFFFGDAFILHVSLPLGSYMGRTIILPLFVLLPRVGGGHSGL